MPNSIPNRPRRRFVRQFFAALPLLLALQGCATVLSPLATDVTYQPPPANAALTRKTVYLYASDKRPSIAVARNAGFAVPLLNQVNISIARPGTRDSADDQEKLVMPLKAMQLAVGSRLNSMGHPVHFGEKRAPDDTHRLVLYLYAFEVDFSEESFSTATVAIAIGRIAPLDFKERKTISPERPADPGSAVYAPICARSVGIGTAQVTAEGRKESADIAMTLALAQAVNTLNIGSCLR